jgi:16S rRNA (cytosine967-C5)-methyltransferase
MSRSRPSRRRGTVDAARLAAYDVLVAVREQDAYSNLLAPPLLRSRGITGRDAAFATELAAGTIRRLGTYDAVLASCLDRGLERVDAAVLDALRLGTHQLLAMRVPPHAAVGTTVDLVRSRIGHGPAGFVNAVLRKVSRRDVAGWLEAVAPDQAVDPVGHASVVTSHPRWVVEALGEALLGRAAAADHWTARADADPVERDQVRSMLEADNDPPRVTLVARPGVCRVEELVAVGGEPGALSPYAVRLPGGDPGEIPAVAAGRAGVQDEGSQAVALALTRMSSDGPDARWLDLCAGPGGKSALLAAVAAQRGARVLAVERLEHRAGLVASATRAVRDGVLGVLTADGTRPAWREGMFDRVLVDAPCSGLGALRRRPEARWRRRPADLDKLVPLQRALLTTAVESVRPGGVVAYVTCSPVLAETFGVVQAVVAERSDVRLEDATELIPDAPGPMPGTVQLWPHLHGTDAMFLALLRRGKPTRGETLGSFSA